MNIPKAIKVLTLTVNHSRANNTPNVRDGILLGIEALKFRLRWEQQEGEDDFPRLPGETEE